MWHPTLCKLDFMKRKFVIILNITLLITVLSFLKVKTWRNIPEATFFMHKTDFLYALYSISVQWEMCEGLTYNKVFQNKHKARAARFKYTPMWLKINPLPLRTHIRRGDSGSQESVCSIDETCTWRPGARWICDVLFSTIRADRAGQTTWAQRFVIQAGD